MVWLLAMRTMVLHICEPHFVLGIGAGEGSFASATENETENTFVRPRTTLSHHLRNAAVSHIRRDLITRPPQSIVVMVGTRDQVRLWERPVTSRGVNTRGSIILSVLDRLRN